MEEMLAVILSMLLVFALIPLFIWKRRHDSRSQRHEEEEEEEPQVAQRETAVRATGAARRMRRRPAAGASSSSAPPAREETIDEIDDEADEYEAGAMTKRERKRQEREAQRQAEQASRESKHLKQEYYDQARRKKDEEREVLERKLEEEAAAKKAKEEEEAALEFQKWKGEFSVDAEGTLDNEDQDGSRGLLNDFVEYIRKHKCVPLEELAAEFKLRTQECINRIASLESMGRLSGVMDDRGKYIYISQEEMRAVTEYIKSRGRVSISHLASKSNQFIDLESKPQFVEDISGDTEEIMVS